MFELKYDLSNDSKEAELGIYYICTFNKKTYFMNYFLCTLQKILFSKKLISQWNTIKTVQLFWSNTTENIYILMYFWDNKISPKWYLKMMFVPWGVI